MADENDTRSGNGTDLDVTKILDEDVDFELEDVLVEEDESALSAVVEPAEAGASSEETERGLTLEDIVFRDEFEAQVEGEVDFELEEEAEKGELSFDEEVQTPDTPGLEEVEEDLDFELDEVVEEAPEMIGAEAEAPSEEEDLDFGLEDIIKEAPEAMEAEPEAPSLEVEEADVFEPEEFPEAVAEPAEEIPAALISEAGPVDERSPATEMARRPGGVEVPALDQERLEAIVKETVRETVSQVLEGILPGVIEEVVTREIEKLRAELEEI
ncbi:MAG: DUF2497 domain-containing protein [Deltaproteobacteria bacterium]|nr:DUF2497 domain-containing protein [Deltaproteobacteria bacterium]